MGGAYGEQVLEVAAVVLEEGLADADADCVRVAADPDLELVVFGGIGRLVEGGRGWEGVWLRRAQRDGHIEGLHVCGWCGCCR